MAEKRKLEYFLLRYVPDAVKGEFVNVGLVALRHGANGAELVDVRFTKDWSRVHCLDPQADVEVLAALEREMRQEIGQGRDRAALLRRMEDSFSGVVQLSPAMAVLTEKDALEEVEDAARIFLEAPKARRTREPAGRQRILGVMRDGFEEAGVLNLLSAVPVAPYTKTGDPFEFDFGYRVGGEIKLLHAVSMRASVDGAVLLAARYPKIAPVMEQVAGGVPLLTAVIEAELDRSRAEVGFALEMMEESQIRVATTAEMAGIAEAVRVELRA
ncbi:MAG TPA: DUF3037 domain-containing protein [Silvibacterium sp.]|nr:DUF3037 domain-containing protein [Silvibacterium sp.]